MLLDSKPAQLPTELYMPMVRARAFKLGMLAMVQVAPRGVLGYAWEMLVTAIT